jgi:hypothetical protein
MEVHGPKKPPSFKENWDPTLSESWLTLFLWLFPAKWLKLAPLAEMNKKLDKEMTWGELIRYLGLWFLMSSVGGGFKKSDFWSTFPFDKRENPCPYNFCKFMSA